MSVLTVTKDNFEEKVIKSEKPVLIDFWAEWCGPCRMMAPFIEEIAEENPDILVGKVNVDEQGELAMKFGISSIPCFVALKNGKVVGQTVGFQPKAGVLAILNND